MATTGRAAAVLALAGVLLLGGAACGDDDGVDGDSAAPTSVGGGAGDDAPGASAATGTQPLTILVTNDDGVGSEGIDLLVNALAELPDVEVVVVAPAENQSGSADVTTGGTLVRNDATTASGTPAVAVVGEPADSVVVALDELGIDPDLVVSGINEGQNIGPLSAISGTVGAAKVAARMGVPAVAVSQGIAEVPDYPTAVEAVLAWLAEHRTDVAAGTSPTDVVTSINVPTCPTGEVRGTVEVPTATSDGGRNLLEVDCGSTEVDPVDDVVAFTTGWIAVARVPAG